MRGAFSPPPPPPPCDHKTKLKGKGLNILLFTTHMCVHCAHTHTCVQCTYVSRVLFDVFQMRTLYTATYLSCSKTTIWNESDARSRTTQAQHTHPVYLRIV